MSSLHVSDVNEGASSFRQYPFNSTIIVELFHITEVADVYGCHMQYDQGMCMDVTCSVIKGHA